jgi:hypothetical protein
MCKPCLSFPCGVTRVIILCLAAISILDAGERAGPDWVRVTSSAEWKARDSQGELVFNKRLWILGGWFNSYEAPPRDVWSSADGKTWTEVTKSAPWIHSDLAMTLTFKHQMWKMGGWYNGRLPGHSASSAVWSSRDGAKWTQVTPKAGWTPRIAAGLVEFRGRMWILGGIEDYYFGDARSLKNDVWSSADGRTWKQETADAGWSPRAYHQAVVHGGKIWIFGGGNYVPEYEARNDVWSSEDGIHWTQVTKAAPWPARLWFSAVTYRGHMWVAGGWSREGNTNRGDVWYSNDGKNWTQLKSDVRWKERHELSMFVFHDKLWIAGGHAKPLSNEVWSLYLPPNFFATIPRISSIPGGRDGR